MGELLDWNTRRTIIRISQNFADSLKQSALLEKMYNQRQSVCC